MDDNFIYFDKDKSITINIPKIDKSTPCWYYLLEGPIFKRAAAYASMKRDMNDCLDAIELLKQSNQFPQIVQTSLIFASIVKYA